MENKMNQSKQKRILLRAVIIVVCLAGYIMRGFVVIIASVFLLSYLFKMTGVWLAFPVAEAITFIVSLSFLVGIKKKNDL